MNLVEAIDAWIDERIDDLSDNDLEWILEIHDAVSASEFVDLETSLLYDEDIAEMVDLAGGNDDDRYYTDLVLRSAFYDEPLPEHYDWPSHNEVAIDTSDDRHDEDITEAEQAEGHDAEQHDAGQAEAEQAEDLDAEQHDEEQAEAEQAEDLDAEQHDEEEQDEDLDEEEQDEDLDEEEQDDADAEQHDEEQAEDLDAEQHDEEEQDDAEAEEADAEDLDDIDLGLSAEDLDEDDIDLGRSIDDLSGDDIEERQATFLDDIADARTTDSFLADVTNVTAVDQAAKPSPQPIEAAVRPVELRQGDELGPSFLPPPESTPAPAGRSWSQLIVSVLIILGLSAFVFGTFQLLASLDDEPEDTATAQTETETASTPEPTVDEAQPFPSATPAPTATPGAVDADAAASEAAPLPRIAIRLVTGDVVLATLNQPGEPPTIQRIYTVVGSNLAPAADISWTNGQIGVVDAQGDVLLLDLDAAGAEPVRLYEATNEVEPAVQIATALEQLAIRTSSGSISLIPIEGASDSDDIDLVWDANEEGAAATAMTSVGDLVPFVLDTGNAQMIVTSSNNEIVQIWDGEEQPPAFNLDASPTGILLGVGQGGVARYELGDGGNLLDSVWDPIDEDDIPAISYSSTGDERVAVVLGDGTLLLSDDDDQVMLWNPADTEIRALSAVGDDNQLVVLLETGSVLRIPLDGNVIESLWDITDETLSAANEIAIEPASP